MTVLTGPPPGIVRVKALYESLRDDVALLATAPPADAALSSEIAAQLAAEARLLDTQAFTTWLGRWDEDATFWVPLTPDGDPETDQALFVDDYGRLRERVWRMGDKSAWALQPPGQTVRLVGSVEAWPLDAEVSVIASSTITIQHTRRQSVFTTSGRQIHRLRRGEDGWRLVRKIMLLPAQSAGTPHLGWLL